MPIKSYEQRIVEWENLLTTRDTNRVVRPLQWGVDWTRLWPEVNGKYPSHPEELSDEAAERYLGDLNREIIADSDRFFSYVTPTDFRLEDTVVDAAGPESPGPEARAHGQTEVAEFLRFTSPVASPYPENNLVSARWFPAHAVPSMAYKRRAAVIVLPQWNAQPWSHNALCRVFNWLGISALRMSKPYHDLRRPAETERSDYAVSANIGRTIDSCRQAVTDVRSCVDWLQSQGYKDFGIVGTSLGSCYAFIASAHDERLRVNAFNHASTYFGDVIWTGQSTRHVRESLEHIGVERLRKLLLAVSPMSYFHKFEGKIKTSLVVYGKYDMTFLPELSQQVVDEFRRHKMKLQVAVLPCGHYTIGETPFKYLDAFYLSRFLASAF